MKIRIFAKFLVLFFCAVAGLKAQQIDNVPVIELGTPTFSIDRPYTISVLVRNSDSRPVIAFPDIPGLAKRGTATSISTSELEGQTVVSQVITQTYMALQSGTIRVPPFSITVNGVTVRSEGTVLQVRPANTLPGSSSGLSAPLKIPTESGAAFLSLRSTKNGVFVGEGFGVQLSLFVSDSYPFELRFDGVDAQLQTVLKQLRPTNAWEEDAGIRELTGQPVVINGRKFTEYIIFQGTFFPLSAEPIQLPSVSLNLLRVRQSDRLPDPTPSTSATATSSESGTPGARRPQPAPKSAEMVERVPFITLPLSIAVKPLPAHPLRGQVPVGSYRLVESIDRTKVASGQSTRYTIRVEGTGNIAALQPPLLSNQRALTAVEPMSPATDAGLEALPAGSNQQINRLNGQVTGSKTFSYFLVPRRGGKLPLSSLFGLVYFDPQTARYDTLMPVTVLTVGEGASVGAPALATENGAQANSIDALYAGLNQMDSTRQPLNWVVLARAIANVLLVLMILGMIFVFLRK
ncbi:hypothetical protein F5984_03030 [Rudanella paleaurantiibacter]|uniref:Protein BatD n=1 Tax=Rudanella paleaurantiibacter TaxID=2614655 RepID=A0A7J5U590_9BACT|nr:BatD family protein [Rudanella paleaurantiibacter]KAB7732936.1 hypothetical protein F5984_03030 [Rudanella paleaurantiibacter]